MERKPRRKTRGEASYPTHDNARSNRRQFLRFLGKGLLAIPAAGLVNACGVGKEREFENPGGLREPDWLETEPDVVDEDLYRLGGVAPEDIDYRVPDVEEFDVGGVAPPPDIEEEFPPLAGDAPPPDLIQQPDTSHEDIQEEDFPPLPGEAPFEPDIVEQDVKKEVDAEEWPVDGDMEIPEGY